MKHWMFVCCLGLGLILAGCAESEQGGDKTSKDSSKTAAVGISDDIAGDRIALTPANTTIEFVGNHTGDDPKPRHGSFQKFTGTAVVDGTLKAIMVDIETASLTTEIEKLTNHLKNTDFFDVNQFPGATFKSTEIKDTGDGIEITGELTLLNNTHSVTFPATVTTDGELTLKAEFEIDRTVWGMDYGLDQIETQVPLTITIGG